MLMIAKTMVERSMLMFAKTWPKDTC